MSILARITTDFPRQRKSRELIASFTFVLFLSCPSIISLFLHYLDFISHFISLTQVSSTLKRRNLKMQLYFHGWLNVHIISVTETELFENAFKTGGIFKTPALRFSVDEKRFECVSFQKRWHRGLLLHFQISPP